MHRDPTPAPLQGAGSCLAGDRWYQKRCIKRGGGGAVDGAGVAAMRVTSGGRRQSIQEVK